MKITDYFFKQEKLEKYGFTNEINRIEKILL